MGTTLTKTSTLRITYRIGMRAGMVRRNDKVALYRRDSTRLEFGYSFKFYVEYNARKGTLEGDRVTKVLVNGQ